MWRFSVFVNILVIASGDGKGVRSVGSIGRVYEEIEEWEEKGKREYSYGTKNGVVNQYDVEDGRDTIEYIETGVDDREERRKRSAFYRSVLFKV